MEKYLRHIVEREISLLVSIQKMEKDYGLGILDHIETIRVHRESSLADSKTLYQLFSFFCVFFALLLLDISSLQCMVSEQQLFSVSSIYPIDQENLLQGRIMLPIASLTSMCSGPSA